jgi:hypothetical protein
VVVAVEAQPLSGNRTQGMATRMFGAEAVRGEIVITSSEARVSMLVSLIVTTGLFALLERLELRPRRICPRYR